ncbi:PaaI family thioesterase [Thermodesulfobacteriota bacterium]
METHDLPYTEDCFVCGEGNEHGLKLKFQMVGDEARTSFTVGPHHVGYKGVLHGGITCALLDETMGWAPAFEKKQMCMLADLRVRFLEPVPVGTTVTVIGETTVDRRRVWETEGRIEGADGKVYARATGKYIVLNPDKSREVEEDILIYPEGSGKIFS